jgi:hypothetical protein
VEGIIDNRTGKDWPNTGSLIWWLFGFIVVGGLALFPAMGGPWAGIVLLAFAPLIAVAMAADARAEKKHGVTRHRYSCHLCGKRWDWREDQPYPYPAGTPLASNAQLLRSLSEQRLAQEEAARREHEAVMWNIIQQQQRNK